MTTTTAPRFGAAHPERFPSYRLLRALSFTHTAIYLCLLTTWIAPGYEDVKYYFGWGHGCGWILMTTLSLIGLRRRTISLTMAAVISIGGAIGPFVGSLTFVWLDRRAAGRDPGAGGTAALPEP